MNSEKKDKEKTNKLSKRKSASTLTNLVGIDSKHIDELVGFSSKHIEELEKNALQHHKITKLMEPVIGTSRQLVSAAFAITSPFTNIVKQIEDAFGLKNALDLITLHQASIALKAGALINLEGIYINLPIGETQKPLSDFSRLTVDIDEFKSYKPSTNEYILRTTTTETTDLGIIKLKTVQQTQLQVQSLQVDVNEIKHFMLEDGKKKDEMLEELLDYFRSGGTSTVKIKKVKYNKKTAELIIDDKTISIKADTNQHYLCKVLFANKESIQRVWEIHDIVEALGEDTDILDGWVKVIYNTVRHLNEKIQLQSGIDRFILYDNKTVIVNPKYLDLPK